MVEPYHEQPELAVEMIDLPLEDGEPQEKLVILRRLVKAFDGVPAVAEAAELNRTQLYRTLSAEGNPSLATLTAILKALRLKLAVKAAWRANSSHLVSIVRWDLRFRRR